MKIKYHAVRATCFGFGIGLGLVALPSALLGAVAFGILVADESSDDPPTLRQMRAWVIQKYDLLMDRATSNVQIEAALKDLKKYVDAG